MPDPEAQPPEPAPAPAPIAAPNVPARTYLPFAAYPGQSATPPAPTWTKAYEHPTARRVVSTGLQLAVEANRDIRRASIYIGLLALGAFGPGVMLLLLGVARLLSDPSIAASIADDPSLVFIEHPEIAGPLLLIYALLIAGGVLVIGISVDAQAMAISILGGRASEQPLRLWEAIVRARQVFWRLLAVDLMVGVVSAVIGLVIVIVFFRPFDSNTGLSFIGSMIGTLVVMPFAFAAAGVVLGDVGAGEALRRSTALFRARPRISLVVTLFALVTSAIQSFAINAGADAAIRVGEFLHLGFDQGPLPLVITVVIVLAFIVAFGSLTFTIAAIVAAPQVTGFLGLTYYSGGLDKARSESSTRPRRFRWVSVPMVIAMVALFAAGALALPSVASFQVRPTSLLLGFIRPVATEHHYFVTSYGPPRVIDDAAPDGSGGGPAFDIVTASYGYLPDVPAWLLGSLFDCNAANVACSAGAPAPGATTFASGAYLFVQRMSGPPGVVPEGSYGEWGPVVALSGVDRAPAATTEPFPLASDAVITFVSGGTRSIRYLQYAHGRFTAFSSNARSAWVGNDLYTLVPVVAEFSTDPVGWDAYSHLSANGVDTSHDSLRSEGAALLQFPGPTEFWLDPLPDGLG